MINLRIVKNLSGGRDLDQFFDQMLYGPQTKVSLRGQTWAPQVDIYETDDNYLLMAEMPGMEPEEIEVMVDRIHLKISGRRRPPAPEGSFRVHRTEISCGNFDRTFRLAAPIMTDRVGASYENGILKITLPKEKASATRIEVY